MTVRIPLGFDFNTQFQEPKSSGQHPAHVTDSCILLCQYFNCQSRAPSGFSRPISIHLSKTTNFLFLLQNGCYQTGNQYRPTFVEWFTNSNDGKGLQSKIGVVSLLWYVMAIGLLH